MTAKTPRGCHEPRGILFQQLPVNAGFVVVSLKKSKAGQLNEVAIPLIVLSQQCEVVVLLAAAFIGSTVVIKTAPARDAFGTVIMCHVGLSTKNRFDALLHAFFVELNDAIHVAVVSNAESLLTIRHSLRDQFIKTGRSVEHGVLSVNVEVCK